MSIRNTLIEIIIIIFQNVNAYTVRALRSTTKYATQMLLQLNIKKSQFIPDTLNRNMQMNHGFNAELKKITGSVWLKLKNRLTIKTLQNYKASVHEYTVSTLASFIRKVLHMFHHIKTCSIPIKMMQLIDRGNSSQKLGFHEIHFASMQFFNTERLR